MTSIREEQKDKGVIIFVKLIFVLAIMAFFLGCAHKPAQIWIFGTSIPEKSVGLNSVVAEKSVGLGNSDVTEKKIEALVLNNNVDERYKMMLVINDVSRPLFCDVFIGSLGIGRYDYFLAPRAGFSLVSVPREEKLLWMKVSSDTSLGRAVVWTACYTDIHKRDWVGENRYNVVIDGSLTEYEGQYYGAVIRITGVYKPQPALYFQKPSRYLANFSLWFEESR